MIGRKKIESDDFSHWDDIKHNLKLPETSTTSVNLNTLPQLVQNLICAMPNPRFFTREDYEFQKKPKKFIGIPYGTNKEEISVVLNQRAGTIRVHDTYLNMYISQSGNTPIHDIFFYDKEKKELTYSRGSHHFQSQFAKFDALTGNLLEVREDRNGRKHTQQAELIIKIQQRIAGLPYIQEVVKALNWDSI